MENQKQTLGEYRVGIGFNPSGDDMVSRIKRQAADLIDLIDTIYGGEEAQDLKRAAMRKVEGAAMWAVKAATKPERE